jgi:hypothetical protein
MDVQDPIALNDQFESLNAKLLKKEEEEKKAEPIKPVQQPQSMISKPFMTDTILVTQAE